MKLKQVIYGLATYAPLVNQRHAGRGGGTDSARYCYSIWLRHLVMAKANGLDPHPKTVAELGPGASLGIGLAALISGCERYFAFDVVEHANSERNLQIFDELVTLFRNRTPIPDNDEFPKVKPSLPSYDFPSEIFDDATLDALLDASRLSAIRDSACDFNRSGALIRYKVPWRGDAVLEKESVDMIYSQAVLEHVDDLRGTYLAMHAWLKPSGYMSHQIDFKCHGTADEWNGHWSYSDFMWGLIKGNRTYLINREPHSTHVAILNEAGFDIVCDIRNRSESRMTADALAPKFRHISPDDMTTSGAFIQSMKNH